MFEVVCGGVVVYCSVCGSVWYCVVMSVVVCGNVR